MIIKYDGVNERYDKTWQEVKDASLAGKTVAVLMDMSGSKEEPYTSFDLYYLTKMSVNTESSTSKYIAIFMGSYDMQTVGEAPGTKIEHTAPLFLTANSPSDYLVNYTIG